MAAKDRLRILEDLQRENRICMIMRNQRANAPAGIEPRSLIAKPNERSIVIVRCKSNAGVMMSSVPDAVPQQTVRRYSNTAVMLHWLTVALVITQALLGFAFANMADSPEKMHLFTWHKTVGALILITTLVRLGYRLSNPPPPYSPDLPRWERLAGTWNHWAFYFLLIVMPLTGLTAVSAQTQGAFTQLAFGIPLPVIPGVSKELGNAASNLHALLALILVVLILLHAAAALKHQFFDKLRAAGRMPPFRPSDGSPVVVGQGKDRVPAR